VIVQKSDSRKLLLTGIREDTQSCRARGVTKVYDRNGYDKEKQEALNAWGARLSRIGSRLELVKAESGEA